jgi:hypothetical protein
MNLPVESFVEQAVNRQVNSLVGDKDINLNTIVKMSLLPEFDANEYQSILAKIKTNNQMEQYYIEKEYDLTYDCGGNLVPVSNDKIPVKCINGETTESQEKPTIDTGGIISKPK